MTAMISTGASSAPLPDWDALHWNTLKQQVKRLQMRIAKATREGKRGKVKALQWLLTHSKAAKLLAVKRVTSNKGAKTAGIDNLCWNTSKQKLQGALSLSRRGYQPSALRRIYIPKKNGKKRPLGIPTMKDRAMQALYLLALEPVAETQADCHSYGFRPKRSAADAIEQCFNCLSRRRNASWVLEADIKACFDQINHQWLLENIPTDKTLLEKWLRCGFFDKGEWFDTEAGTPQGGIISPTLANMALDGIASCLKRTCLPKDKVNLIRYADDCVITGISKELLQQQVKPAIEQFLKRRGLSLSLEKTRITHIDNGFDFLGFNLRKYKGKLLIKPAKYSVKNHLAEIRGIIKSNPTCTTENLIRLLNPKISGWSNYYRQVVAYDTFRFVDYQIHWAIWRWCKRRHPLKNNQWISQRYYHRQGLGSRFYAPMFDPKRQKHWRWYLHKAADLPIVRHIKIRADYHPYLPEAELYFARRQCWIKNRKQEAMQQKLFMRVGTVSLGV